MDLPTRLGLKRLAQLRRAWVDVEHGAISRITSKACCRADSELALSAKRY
jgi:hypothetical protein